MHKVKMWRSPLLLTLTIIWSYYETNEYFPHAVFFILVTDLVFNWRFVSLYPFHLFCTTPPPPALWQPPADSLYLSLFLICLLICFFIFLHSTYSKMAFSVLFHLASIPSKSIHVFGNGKISFLWPGNIPLHNFTTSSLCIHLSSAWGH